MIDSAPLVLKMVPSPEISTVVSGGKSGGLCAAEFQQAAARDTDRRGLPDVPAAAGDHLTAAFDNQSAIIAEKAEARI